MEMQTNSSVRLTAVGINHHLHLVQVQAKQAPGTAVKAEEIVSPAEPHFAAKLDPEQPTLNHQDIVFYKHEGKYMVLLGRETARRALESGTAVLSGKLVSKQALKRCRIDSGATPAPRPVQVETKRPVPTDFKDTLASIDKSTLRSASSGSNTDHKNVSHPSTVKVADSEYMKPQKEQPSTTAIISSKHLGAPSSSAVLATKHEVVGSINTPSGAAGIKEVLDKVQTNLRAPQSNMQTFGRLERPAAAPASQYSEDDKLTPDQQERVRRAKEQHAKDNAAGTVTFAEPDWREKFSAKYGRFPGSPNVKPNPDKQQRPPKTPNSGISGQHMNSRGERLRVAVAEVGGYANKPKADTKGMSRFNPSQVNPSVEPGQDRPMQEFGQVDRILTDVRPGGGPRRPSQFGGGRRRSTH